MLPMELQARAHYRSTGTWERSLPMNAERRRPAKRGQRPYRTTSQPLRRLPKSSRCQGAPCGMLNIGAPNGSPTKKAKSSREGDAKSRDSLS